LAVDLILTLAVKVMRKRLLIAANANWGLTRSERTGALKNPWRASSLG